MAAAHGYFEWYDLTKSFNDIRDYRGDSLAKARNNNSITAVLDGNDFKYFSYLVTKSRLANRYDDPQAAYTVFAPRDDTLDDDTKRFITNADINLARQLVDSATIPRIIRAPTLMEPGVYWADTRNSSERLLVDNRQGNYPIISGHKILAGNLDLENGVVYQIMGLIIPSRIL
jgi:hypothetical protein